jgi:TRAP-type C4-dicarboxylate transport system permease small subunit
VRKLVSRGFALYGRSIDLLDRFALILCSCLLIAMVALNGLEAIGRYFGKSSIYYVQISLALGTLVYFFGYLILLRRNEDVTVAFVYDRLPPIVRDLLDVLISSAIVLFFAVLLYASLSYYRLTHAMMHPILPVAQSTTILPIAVGAAGSLWVAIYKAAVNIRTFVENRRDSASRKSPDQG